jgi:AAA ATPase domain
MSNAHRSPARLPRLADQLAAAHVQRFWGREDELALFGSALRGGAGQCSIFYVHGLGGVGKSALLRACAGVAAADGVAAVSMDGRVFDPSPGGFLLALRDALDLDAADSPLDALRDRGRVVLMLDSYELLASIDPWLRQTFLPRLPARTVVVIAGRNPPALEWTADLGWGPALRAIPLQNLSPEESRSLLTERGVPDRQHAAVLAFTHGHPLALVLVAEVVRTGGADAPFHPECAPNLVGALLERLVASAPSAAHRRALELAAHVRVTTEPLVGAIIERADAHELFEWLRGLSFIEQGPEGLFPHDVTREAIDADFRWRDPDGYRDLHRRVWLYLRDRLRNATGRAQQRAFFDKLYLHRANPIGARYHDYGTLGSVYAEPAVEGDHPAIVAAVRAHEGGESARIAEHWLRRQPQGFHVIRGVGAGLLALVATIALDEPSPMDMEADPAVRAAWEFARRRGPLRAGERMLHHRFHIASDVYQQVSPAINLLATMVTVAPMKEARPAWTFITFAEAEPWQPIMGYINFERADEAGFIVGDHRYAVFAHDWRVQTFDAWWEREAEISLAREPEPELSIRPNTAPLVVFSESEFSECVRQALRDYTSPAALSASMLLRSRVVIDVAGGEAAVASLRALLREAVERLGTVTRDAKFYRALLYTYIQPAESQERAAERLGIPFGTYRYHLAQGTARVVAWLWQRELYGRSS